MKNATHNLEKIKYECRAKNTLFIIFPDEFSGLEKSEKPDWVDNKNSIGVEVVRVLDSDCLKERKHFNKEVAGLSELALSPKVKGELEKYKGRTYTEKDLGISDSDVIVSHVYPIIQKDITNMQKDITNMQEYITNMVCEQGKSKIEKLNSYKDLKRTYLYILCNLNSYDEINKVFNYLHKEQQGRNRQFYGIFIDNGVKLYRHDFCERSLSDIAQEIFVRTEMEIVGNVVLDVPPAPQAR